MDLYYEMLMNRSYQLPFASSERQAYQLEADRWVEMESFQALAKIKAILENDSLRDDACFQQIEEIVCVFEALGSGAGNRHDFG